MAAEGFVVPMLDDSPPLPPTVWDTVSSFLGVVFPFVIGLVALLVLYLVLSGLNRLYRWFTDPVEENKEEARKAKAEAEEAEKAAHAAKRKEQEKVNRRQAFERACATARIKDFRVVDGRGKDRHSVIIEIDWSIPAGCKQATLHLWKSEYPFRNPGAVQHHDWRQPANELDFEPDGRPLRFIDTKVTDREPTYYYAWITIVEDAGYNADSARVCFEKRHHVARFSETFAELARRRIERMRHEDALRAAEEGRKPKAAPVPALPPPKRALVDEALEIAASLLQAKKSTEQLYARLDAWCEAQNLSDEDAEVIKEEVLRQLDGKQ